MCVILCVIILLQNYEIIFKQENKKYVVANYINEYQSHLLSLKITNPSSIEASVLHFATDVYIFATFDTYQKPLIICGLTGVAVSLQHKNTIFLYKQ